MNTTADEVQLSAKDVCVLRELAAWKVAAAATPENREKIKAWTEHDAGAPGARVMVKAETWYTTDPKRTVNESELRCENQWARNLERELRLQRYALETLKDDTFVLPWMEYCPQVWIGGYGVPSGVHRDPTAPGLAFNYQPALKTLDASELRRLHPREIGWSREGDERLRERFEQVFEGIVKVRRRLHGWQLCLPMTSVAFDFVGLDGFMLLIYDNPEGLHKLLRFIRDDHLRYLEFMEANDLLSLNNEADYIGSGCVGCSKLLPAPDYQGKARPKDLWYFCESQEAVSMSPEHYGEFVFPYLKEIADRFGRVYYGCCEPVDPVWEYVSTLKSLQRVSVSPWASEEKMGKFCRERKTVYSRKMPPQLFMAEKFNQADEVRRSVAHTVACTAGARLEFVLRDVYTLRDEPDRFRQWVELVREGGREHRG